ncbi:hypothetical protein [Lancefieldella rimae]|uniref:hypothetical protein n=1 Tax=Lancefieldella rimae TaxID=1383 RepID=UPI002880BD93|nr:hypothetical protein [Lancefieldella rimae]
MINQIKMSGNIPKRRITLLLLIIVVGMAVGVLIIPRITLFVRSYVEVQPLLERARTIMDGTADPAPSEELDGELFRWRFRKTGYPEVTQIEVSPIKILGVVPDDSGGIILTVNFEITRYRANGKRDSWASYTSDKWYVRKNGNRWIVYKIESKP